VPPWAVTVHRVGGTLGTAQPRGIGGGGTPTLRNTLTSARKRADATMYASKASNRTHAEGPHTHKPMAAAENAAMCGNSSIADRRTAMARARSADSQSAH